MKYMNQNNQNACKYCSGNGYVLLLLGGTETCYACKGTGKTKEKDHFPFHK